jgi:DNA (cytosine-5)-methyltransferase 1
MVRLFPTPLARDHKDTGDLSNVKRVDTLPRVVQAMERPTLWPTPAAADNRDRGNLSTPAIRRRMEKGKQVNLSMMVSEKSGRLNPAWVGWLMGFPEGWTD